MREPMKAQLHERPFDDPDWIFERKLDGIRAIARRSATGVELASRTGKRLTGSYPELVEVLEGQPSASFTADGEIVAFEGSRTSFERLQGRMGIHDPRLAALTGIPVYLYLFDLLELDGHDLRALPLRSRKSALRRALAFGGPLRFTAHRNTDGERFFEEACERGWEGLVAKRASSPYRHGRSPDWLKLKCSASQELVIGGYTPPGGSREHFGALLVGYYADGELRYAGKVGTGFTRSTLAELGARLKPLEVQGSPFSGEGPPREARWVAPQLVAEIAFGEWTRAGRLRHPRYVGLRDDKKAGEVIRERPAQGGSA